MNFVFQMGFFSVCFLSVYYSFIKYVECLLHAICHSMLQGVAGIRTDRLSHKTHSSGKKDAQPTGKGIGHLLIFLYCFKTRKMLNRETFCEMKSGIISRKRSICLPFSFLIINHHLRTFSSSLY